MVNNTETPAKPGNQAAKPPAPRRFDSAEQETYLTLWRTYDRLRLLDEQLFSQFDLTAQQYNLLRLLERTGKAGVPTLSLVDRLVSRAPDITRMLDRLESGGWIVRNRTPTDRRAVLVQITPAGLGLLKRIAGPLQKCHERQLGHLSSAELKVLTRLLHKARAPHEPDDSPWREE